LPVDDFNLEAEVAMGLTNVIINPAKGHQYLRYTCINQMLHVGSGAAVECTGEENDCEWCRHNGPLHQTVETSTKRGIAH
jgi:hypothetical protein